MFLKALTIAAAGVASVAAGGATSYYMLGSNDGLAGSTVKITHGKGHGSAVHIGKGFFVTAAHVVGEASEMTYKDDAGETGDLTVMWSNTGYDVALLRGDAGGVDASDLDCRAPEVGEVLTLKGNPLFMEYLTLQGTVAGKGFEAAPTWKSIIPVDGSMAPGMSGGGAFDDDGDLVGINVGGALAPAGGFGRSFVGISFIVPASDVCALMGRG